MPAAAAAMGILAAGPRSRPAGRRRGPARASAGIAREVAEADWALPPGEAWPAWWRASLAVGSSLALWATLAGAVLLVL